MDDLAGLIRKSIRIALYAVLVCLAAGLLIPAIRPFALGLALGIAASAAMTWHLGYKTGRITRNLVENTGKRTGLGFATRVCIVLAATVIAYKEPWVDLVGMVVGLVFVQFTIVASGILSAFKKQ